MKVSIKVLFLVVLSLLVSACADQAPRPDSDSGLQYENSARIPVDDKVYDLTVVANDQVVNHTELNARGSSSVYGSSGMVSGSSSFRMWQEGKGLMQVRVVSIDPPLVYVVPGEDLIIKTTDLKVMAIVPGTEFRVRCRNQYEAVAAVRTNSTFNQADVETWELDFCRMEDPNVEQKGLGE